MQNYNVILFVIFIIYYGPAQSQRTLRVPEESTLEDLLCGSQTQLVTDATTIDLSSSESHFIAPGQFCLLQNLASITIESRGEEMANISCSGDSPVQSGIAFYNIHGLTIRKIRFENCGGIIRNALNYESLAQLGGSPRNAIDNLQQAVLVLSNSMNVNLENVTFNNYRGYAIFAINLLENVTLQQVTVTNSFFFTLGKTSSSREDLFESGSGLLFHSDDSVQSQMNQTCRVLISGATISNNYNIYPMYYSENFRNLRAQNQPRDFPLFGSGGISVFLRQRRYRVYLQLSDTEISDNGGTGSGGAVIYTINTVNSMDLKVTRCTFTNNYVRDYSNYAGGGGLQLFFVYAYTELTDISREVGRTKGTVTVEDTLFQNHTGDLGAAVAIYNEAQDISRIEIEFKRVAFLNNEAVIDGDCILARGERSAYFNYQKMLLRLEDLTVLHTGRSNNLDLSASVSIVNIDVEIVGTGSTPSVYSNGMNSALKGYNTDIFLSGNVQFVNNSAPRGGAITLEANSYLFFTEPAKILFSNNTATISGGAIYSESVRGVLCVMQFLVPRSNYSLDQVRRNSTELRWLNFSISFDNNMAPDGQSAYVQPVYNCQWYSESVVQIPSNLVSEVYEELFDFTMDGESVTFVDQIRSYPYRPCFCLPNSTTVECLADDDTPYVVTYPGQYFTFNVVPVDVMNQTLRSQVEAQITESDRSVRFQNGLTYIDQDLVGTECTQLDYSLEKAENVNVSLDLSVHNGVEKIFVDIYLQECPFGFELNETSGICDCIPLYRNNSITCDINKMVIIKPKSAWFGLTTDNGTNIEAYASHCPTGYCLRSEMVTIGADTCVGNHTGEICGQCKANFSIKFGTTDCGICSNYWIFTILLYMVAGILLVFLLFLLNLNISDGPLGTVLFYTQLFSINIGFLVASNETRFATVFVALLNLELGFSLCFYDGMTTLGKLGLQFVFPVYLWVLVAILTILSQHSSKLSNLIGSECVKVFVTLIYLSYSKLIRTTFQILVPQTIETNVGDSYNVWYFDGSMRYMTGGHLALGLLSIAVLILIIVPYTVFMLLAQWCLHISWVSTKFKPLIDANLAPYKDRVRFWFGLKLSIIAVLSLSAIILTARRAEDQIIYLHVIIIFLLLVFQASFKPYRSKVANFLDIFFLVNYFFFLSACIWLYSGVFPSSTNFMPHILAVEILTVGSAFAVFVFIILYHTVLRMNLVQHLTRKVTINAKDVSTKMEPTMPPLVARYAAGHDTDGRVSYDTRRGATGHSPVTIAVTTVTLNDDDDGYAHTQLREALLEDF